MPSMQIFINSREPIGPNVWTSQEGLQHIINYLNAAASGRRSADTIKFGWNDSVLIDDLGALGQAAGLVVFASTSGAVGATLGGTLVTTTFATSDTITATAFAAAVRANTTVNAYLTATNQLAQMTLATVVVGTTVQVGTAIFTAIANGSTPRVQGEYSIGANDTAAALALVRAIHRHPSTCGRYRAVSVAGAVFIGLPDGRVPLPVDAIRNPMTVAGGPASTITVNVAVPVAGTRTMVLAAAPGSGSNFITAVASGTGSTYATNGNSGQLGSGSGALTPTFTNDVLP